MTRNVIPYLRVDHLNCSSDVFARCDAVERVLNRLEGTC